MALKHVQKYVLSEALLCIQIEQLMGLVGDSLRLPAQCLRAGKECVYIQSRRGRRLKGSKSSAIDLLNTRMVATENAAASGNASVQPELDAGLHPDLLIDYDDDVFDSVFFNPSYPFTPSLEFLVDGQDLQNLGILRQYRCDHDMLVEKYLTFLWVTSPCSPFYSLSLDAYYIWIHPTFPVLPDPQYSPVDRPLEWRPVTLDELPGHTPSNPLILAILAIVVMIPMPGSVQAKTPAMRRQFSAAIAKRAYYSVVFEDQSTGVGLTMSRSPVHPLVPPELESILALCLLGQYEYLQNGDMDKMQSLTREALENAIRLQLHLQPTSNQSAFDDARQRAWWTVVCPDSSRCCAFYELS